MSCAQEIRNSWGTYWGELGFTRIQRGVNALRIEEGDCWYAQPEHVVEDAVMDGQLEGSMKGLRCGNKHKASGHEPVDCKEHHSSVTAQQGGTPSHPQEQMLQTQDLATASSSGNVQLARGKQHAGPGQVAAILVSLGRRAGNRADTKVTTVVAS